MFNLNYDYPVTLEQQNTKGKWSLKQFCFELTSEINLTSDLELLTVSMLLDEEVVLRCVLTKEFKISIEILAKNTNLPCRLPGTENLVSFKRFVFITFRDLINHSDVKSNNIDWLNLDDGFLILAALKPIQQNLINDENIISQLPQDKVIQAIADINPNGLSLKLTTVVNSFNQLLATIPSEEPVIEENGTDGVTVTEGEVKSAKTTRRSTAKAK